MYLITRTMCINLQCGPVHSFGAENLDSVSGVATGCLCSRISFSHVQLDDPVQAIRASKANNMF